MPAVVAGGAVLVIGAGEDCVSSDDCGRSSLPDMFFFFFFFNVSPGSRSPDLGQLWVLVTLSSLGQLP